MQTEAVKIKELAAIDENGGVFSVNGREYELSKLTHSERLVIFAYYTTVMHRINVSDFGFMGDPQWRQIENRINEMTLFDGLQISKCRDHWETYPEDYMGVVCKVMPLVSYPFLRGSATA